MRTTILSWALPAAALAAALPGAAPAQRGRAYRPAARPAIVATGVIVAPVAGSVFQVNTGRGRLVTLARPMTDLFIADDQIADVQVRSPTQLYIFGKKTGETTLSATGRGGEVVYATTVRVGNNLDSIGSMLALAMPDAKIVATPMNGLVLLTGTVGNPDDAAEAERLVQAFVGADLKVLSRLKTATPLQVNLQVRVAEVSRTFVKNIGNRLTTTDRPGGGFQIASDSGKAGTITYDPTTGAKTSTYSVGGGRTTLGLAGRLLGTDILSAIDLGETIGQVTTLANTNLTALSGETATFLAGGEIPIPLSQGLGTVSVDYKQYGVSLSYTPTVLSDGHISMRVRPEVSQLDYSSAVQIAGTTVPGLTTRRVESTVELGSGQSIMIGGLLSNNHNNSIDKTPALGDLPVVGALFRSNGFRRSETELVIVITPYLVRPVDKQSDIALPTDGYRAPNDIQRVLLGELDDSDAREKRPVPTMAPAGAPQPSIGASAPVPVAPVPAPTAPTAATPDRARAPSGKRPLPTPGFSQ